jgi:hypothetical protein
MDEIKTLQKLAGIGSFQGYTPFQVDENPSITATAVRKKEKEMGVKPGDKEWFKLWFSKPYMTGTPKFRGRKKK